MPRLLFTIIFGLSLALTPSVSFAKKKAGRGKRARAAQKQAKEPKGPSAEVTQALTGLTSENPDVVMESIQVLGALADPAAVPPLLELLETGPRSDITDSILFALAGIPGEEAVPTLSAYTKHRRPDARSAALMALEKRSGSNITRTLEDGLRDSDRQVRATAAMTLGARGDASAVPILFEAFERDVPEAASAIGQLGSEADAKRMTRYLGREDIKVLLGGFEEFLKRESFPEAAKLNILNRLFDLAGPEVWRFAVNFKATFPPDTNEAENNVYKLVSRMVRQIKDK